MRLNSIIKTLKNKNIISSSLAILLINISNLFEIYLDLNPNNLSKSSLKDNSDSINLTIVKKYLNENED